MVAALAVGGCGSSSSAGTDGPAAVVPGGGSTSSGTAPPTLPRPHGSASPLPTTVSSLSPGAERVSLAFRLDGVNHAGTLATVSLEVGGCTSFDAMQVRQTTSTVEIGAEGQQLGSGAGVSCPAIARIVRGTVAITPALGSRHLVHAPVTPSG